MLPMELDPDDDLILRVQTSVDNADVSGRARVFRHGRVDFVPLQFPSPTSDRAQYNTSIGLGGGTLLGARISTALATAKRGQIYAQLEVRNRRRTDVSEVMLCKGYVYAGNSVGDGEFVESGPGGGEGFITTINIADAVPGAQFATQTVPTNAIWKVQGFKGDLVASSVAGTRQFRIDYTDGTNVIAAAVAVGKTIASRTNLYRGAIGLTGNYTGDTAAGDGDAIIVPLPNILLREGSTLVFLTLNGDPTATTGDDWDDTGFLQAEEWLVL